MVKLIDDTCETLTGLKWSCDVRQVHVLEFLFYPFAVAVEFVRAKASFRQHIFDDIVMYEVFKGGEFDFVGLGCTNNWMVLCEFHKDFFEFLSIYKTCMPHANVTKKI